MPIHYIRTLTSQARSPRANRHLGFALAFTAGAINAGGFLAVRQYTSHMTGIISAAADRLALGAAALVLDALGALLSFLLGAACTAVMVNHARRRGLASEYALPLLLEALLLLAFGVLGARLAGVEGLFVPVTVMLLCFMMGLQNALMTKLSHAEIRTTHMTGIVTDIGIELGKLPYRTANGARLRLLCTLLLCFFGGGVLGALGFAHVGYLSTVPLALLLCVLAIVPALDDLGALARR
ncbi:YoaK family protein [uncultured Massilia sp.]|uniref:YoaK family protein n=1 Tax=uncultured Massilia sp. TaxID=169973 RepID=UPI00260098F1|nr:YoaK family protein [uncultured Massilia sp.]